MPRRTRPEPIRQAPAPSPKRGATPRSIGSRAKQSLDIFSDAITRTLPWMARQRSQPATCRTGCPRWRWANRWPERRSMPKRWAIADAGPGKRRSDEPEETRIIPRSLACTPARSRHCSAAATAHARDGFLGCRITPLFNSRNIQNPAGFAIQARGQLSVGDDARRQIGSEAPDRRHGLHPALDVALDARDGFELARIQIGIGDLDAELAFQFAHQVRQRERIEESGVEERLVRIRRRAVLLETFRTIARIRSLLSILLIMTSFGADA